MDMWKHLFKHASLFRCKFRIMCIFIIRILCVIFWNKDILIVKLWFEVLKLDLLTNLRFSEVLIEVIQKILEMYFFLFLYFNHDKSIQAVLHVRCDISRTRTINRFHWLNLPDSVYIFDWTQEKLTFVVLLKSDKEKISFG